MMEAASGRERWSMARRRYTDNERSEALAALCANGGNIEATAKQLGMPYRTLRQWANGERHPEATQMSIEKRAPLADRLDVLAHALVDDMLKPAMRKEAGIREVATAFGIIVDKTQLLRGKPTNINHDGLTDDQRRARLVEIFDAARARRDGQIVDGGPAGSLEGGSVEDHGAGGTDARSLATGVHPQSGDKEPPALLAFGGEV